MQKLLATAAAVNAKALPQPSGRLGLPLPGNQARLEPNAQFAADPGPRIPSGFDALRVGDAARLPPAADGFHAAAPHAAGVPGPSTALPPAPDVPGGLPDDDGEDGLTALLPQPAPDTGAGSANAIEADAPLFLPPPGG